MDTSQINPIGRAIRSLTASVWCHLAEAALSFETAERAVDFASRALRSNPDHAAARLCRARAFCRLEKFESALADFEAGGDASLSADDSHRRGLTLFELKRFADACPWFEAAIQVSSHDPTPHLWLGRAWTKAGQPAKALPPLEQALLIDPRHGDAHFWFGEALFDLGRHQEAERAFGRCLLLAPEHTDALLWRADVRTKLGDYDEALSDLLALERLTPQSPLPHHWRGLTYHHLRKFEDAIREFDEAIRKGSRDFATHRQRGHALSWLDRWEEADQAYAAALELSPEQAHVWSWKAGVSKQLKDYERALDEIDQAIRLEPRVADHFWQRARIWWWQFDYDAALDDCDQALRLEPKNAQVHELQGQLLSHSGDHARAVASFDQALAIDSSKSTYLVNRSEAWEALGYLDRAVADLDTALRNSPKDGSAWLRRARLHQEAGDHRAAITALDSAVQLLPKDRQALRLRAKSLEEIEEFDRADADYNAIVLLDEPLPDTTMSTTTNTRLLPLLRAHFDPVPLGELELTERMLNARMRPDLQRALNAWTAGRGEIKHFSGVRGPNAYSLGLADLMGTGGQQGPALAVPPDFDDLGIGETEPVRCVKTGIWLLERDGLRCAVVSSLAQGHVRLQVAVPKGKPGEETSADFVKTLETAARSAAAYRGKVISLDCQEDYDQQTAGIRVHRLRGVAREEIVLPAKTLELLERNVLRFVVQRASLKERGLSTKKGLLFYGPPGTGKSHTIHYLAGALEGHTMLLVTASEIGNLSEYMSLARLLQPAIIVLEDVDLIARSRGALRSAFEESLLNRLLNEMDGLTEDAEILFILTTNHPEHLEKALASRPGRVDQAIEFPLPDDEGRAQLARLYAGKQSLAGEVVDEIVRRTPGVSASFIKELLRRATQFQLERDGQGPLLKEDVEFALQELVFAGGTLNAKLLGGAEARKVKGFSTQDGNLPR